jgi:transcription initiation factor TFIIIB Brf1 subunit/transcription initiation factor TFIIB
MDNLFDRDDLLSIFNSVKDYTYIEPEYNLDQCIQVKKKTVDKVNENSVKSMEEDNQNTLNFDEVDLDISSDDYCFNSENCKNCETDSLVYEDGAYFCHKCGLFQEVRINQEQEWRFYGDSDSKSTDPTRVGMPMNQLLPESSLGTVISNKGSHSIEFEKLRQYHTWNTMPYKERSLYRVYERLQSKAVKAGIPLCIIENAKSMYKQLSEAQISRGANRRGLMASCIYIACKMENVPRSAKEIADIYDLKVSEMTKGCKKFLEIMNLKKNRKNYVIGSSTPMNYIKRFCSKLALSTDIYHICEYVAYATTKLDIVDENTPPSIAAGSIFLVMSLCNINVSKRQVAAACKISEVTISKCYKKLYIHRQKLFPPTVIAKYKIEVD